MNNNKKHILKHFRTSTKGLVIPKDLIEIGEIALNVNSESPMLMFKGNDDEINILSPNKLSESYVEVEYPIIDDSVSFISSRKGDSLDVTINKLDTNVSTLVSEVLDNETVCAAAFTEIKDSIGLDENLKYVVNTDATYISNATSLSEADNLLDIAIKTNEESIQSINETLTLTNENIKNMSNGGYIFIEKFDKVNFQNALTLALESLDEDESAIIDCTYFKGNHTITEGFEINNPVTLIFGGIDLSFNNLNGSNLFTFNSNNISLQGINRNTDKTQTENGATIFRMLNVDNTLEGYHIKSRGNKNLEINNITFVGIRTTMGHQYGNSSYDIDGVGGIYIEKAKPEVTEGGNTCNNIRIENVLIAGSKAHGIYIDTPILSSIKNVRLSDCGGHGVFINGGTSILFENTYVSSSDMAGFCIYGSSYVSLNNCVAENGGIGFWIRSSFNVTMTSPGVEATKNHGANPWRYSQPITNKYGLNLSTLSSDGSTSISIPDVNSDASSYFRGYGILISGGKSINVFTPYIKSISQPAINAGYPNGAENTSNVKYINVIGDARSVYISNPSFKEMDNSSIPTLIKHEIGIEEDVINLELVYNTEQTTLKGTLDNQHYVTDNAKRAPIYCKSTSTVLRNGNFLLTNYKADTPLDDLELANKKYVDDKFNSIEIPEVSLSSKLSDDYISVTYPSLEDTDNVIFTACEKEDTLDIVAKKIDTNVSTLVSEVLDNEKTISKGIIQISESIGLSNGLLYEPKSTANYIKRAKTLYDADIILDKNLKKLETKVNNSYSKEEIDSIIKENAKIADLEKKVNNLELILKKIIVSVGLDENGAFIVPTTAQTSGYTTDATSVMSAIYLMDNQIEENETVTAYALSDLNERVNKFEDANKTALDDLNERIINLELS